MASSLRSKQIECLKRMLNLNENAANSSSTEPSWKVLVYDRFGQDIISPLLTVKELRELGVTLHLLLHSDRDIIPDVPAIYFVFPTEENVQRICRDLQNGLYEKYYLNFISPISRHRLEDLATSALQHGSVELVSKVVDQYLNYISLEDDFFTVKHHDRDSISYYALNKADAKDTDIEHICDTLVDSLFSFLVTTGTVPIIRCPKGNAAEMVAEVLDKKIRENLRDSRNSLFTTDIQSGNFSFQRPVLIILDRNNDLCTPLHHTWTYQALCHDIFDLQLNRVSVQEPDTNINNMANSQPTRKQVKKYDLSVKDKFWNQHKISPFPNVAESIQKELDDYRSSEEEVKKLKNMMGVQNEEDEMIESMWSDNTTKLTNAVSSLPELLEKKRMIDMHMNIATAMLEHIKHRKLDIMFETEEKIMSKSSLETAVLDIIQDPEAGSPDDKLRLFLIYYISTPHMSQGELDQHINALTQTGCDTSCLSYMKKWKAFNKVASGPIQTGSGQSTYSAMFSRIMSTGSQFVMEGVKSLVVGTKNLPVTRIVDAIMDHKNIPETEDYRYFDPKMLKVSESSQRNKSFQDAIVFIVGGGNYIEYANLISYEKRQGNNQKKITYGCSELLNANQFLKQLQLLGSK
ncbi:sec1 family domain-containing protein 1-like [Hydractinia symbiolongicarpus]|uniref:sec1 family domain-containing protein 1-like n=1 Tax=Hydractinia symbiolongicarpus TaxID=13093 RepID=UPI00254B348B|nr:sec1 family domain-containing protein 1-like [Hydractinia symbiolongicarpus]